MMVRAQLLKLQSQKGGGLRATGVVCRGVRQAKYGVISNAGAFNLTNGCSLRQLRAYAVFAEADAGAFDPSVALVYLFVGLDGSDQELELPVCN